MEKSDLRGVFNICRLLQESTKDSKSETYVISKLLKSNDSNEKQLPNMTLIYTTFDVSKLLKSRSSKLSSFANIQLIFVTLDVSKLLKSMLVRLLQQ